VNQSKQKGDEILNEIVENHNENIKFQALYFNQNPEKRKDLPRTSICRA